MRKNFSVVYAQLTLTGNNVYTTTAGNNVVVGASAPLTINASSGLFPGGTLKHETLTGNVTTGYSEFVTIRHIGLTSDALSRQLDMIFKLSNEANINESNKMGG